jgi:hypothetical protein
MSPRRNLTSLPIRAVLSLAVVASVGLAAACASSTNVGITKSDAVVAGCSKLGEVSVDKRVPESDVNDALAAEARKQNGNYVVIGSDGARTGVAYRCATPSAAASR